MDSSSFANPSKNSSFFGSEFWACNSAIISISLCHNTNTGVEMDHIIKMAMNFLTWVIAVSTLQDEVLLKASSRVTARQSRISVNTLISQRLANN